MHEELRGKTKMIATVSREREEVVTTLLEKERVEEVLRLSGNKITHLTGLSMLRKLLVEEVLNNDKQLLEQRTEKLTEACAKQCALEQELSMYKVDVRFRDLGAPPGVAEMDVQREYVEESGYVSKAPLYPVEYGMTSGIYLYRGRVENFSPVLDELRVRELYRPLDTVLAYSEGLPPDRCIVLEEQLCDKELDRVKVEKKLADLERELDEKEGWLKDAETKLNDVEDRLDQETRGREQVEGDLLLRTEELYQLREVEARLAQSEAEVADLHDALKNKTREVKEMRNAITQAGEVESEHVKARLRAREAELERQKAAYEDARRGFQEKQRELNKMKSAGNPEEEDRLRREVAALRQERDALRGRVADLEADLELTLAEREDMGRELDRLRDEEAQLRDDVETVAYLLVDKETQFLAEELEETLDRVNNLENENRRLKEIRDEDLHRAELRRPRSAREAELSFDDLDNSYRPIRDGSFRSPRSRSRIRSPERDHVVIPRPVPTTPRDFVRSVTPDDDLARRIMKFLDDHVPKQQQTTTAPPPPPAQQAMVDVLPLVKVEDLVT
eukprot:sb/3479755/